MTAFLSDWRARDGTVVGVEIRHGDSPASWHLVQDVRFDDPRGAEKIAAWCKGHAVQDLRETELIDLADGPAAQHLVPGVPAVSHTAREIAREALRRSLRRTTHGGAVGPLFGQPTSTQGDLFA